MARTPEEEQELQALLQQEQIEQSKLPQFAKPGGQSNRTPQEEQELQQLLLEEQEASQAPQYAKPQAMFQPQEAELGTLNRLQYAVEPLETNRRAFLINKFGQENVLEDKNGDLYIRQEGEIRPVNQVGFSQADIAELVGASPELASTALGAVGGGIVGTLGLPGPGTAAGAALGGATAGAVGSGIRQAASAFLTDVPQEATAGERATEAAISGGLGALGGVTANVAGKMFKGMLKTVAPELGKRAAQVEATSAKFGLPKATTGQTFGGILERQEKTLAETPFFGRKIRKELQKQSDEITKALKREVGDFSGVELAAEDVGNKIKTVTTEKIKAIKGAAGEMFEDFTANAKGIQLSAGKVKNDFLNKLKTLNLYDDMGAPLPYNPARTGIPQAEFEKVQASLTPLIEAFDQGTEEVAGRKVISTDAINNLRKSLDGTMKLFKTEGAKIGMSDKVLLQAREAYMDTVEDSLQKAAPGLKARFKAARVMWKDALDQEKMAGKLGIAKGYKEIADEKVLGKAFTDTKSFDAFDKLVGREASSEAALKYTEDVMRKASSGDRVSAARILTEVSKKQSVLKRALGREKVNNLIQLLEFAKQNAIPVNPSMTEITKMQGSSIESLAKGITLRTYLGIASGSLKAPGFVKAGTAAGVQAYGQEKKRKMGFKKIEVPNASK